MSHKSTTAISSTTT